ncbi:caspase family protein [uncultured Desulfovibrio sp.]|uniref:caspase family protein n=1 Tax=uncultured Desulfovibrio sp. TaxID=167968 RepID=UPI00266FF245|nr:caspase family protein [uncultured Desulfovibrio sp.]
MRKALIIGIDNYKTCPLEGCCNDADSIEQILRCNGDESPNFSTKIFKNVQTKAALKKLIEDCFSGDADVALFYYSGHGHIDNVGGYLVTPDFGDHDFGVSLQDVLTIANNSRCKDKIIILDSCYSGIFGSISTLGQSTAVINEGVTILTASRSTETSIEINGHGLFTSLLLEALNGGAADITGHITPGGIYAYIDKALGPWEQRPVFKTNVTRFTPLRKVIPQVDISIIRKICTYFPNENSQLPIDPSFEPTNSLDVQHNIIPPYADPHNTKIFSDLQKLEGIGLVVPIGEDHMYFAAMHSKSCALTSIGKQYWRLVNDKLI